MAVVDDKRAAVAVFTAPVAVATTTDAGGIFAAIGNHVTAVHLNQAGRAVDVAAYARLVFAGGGGVEGGVAAALSVDVQLLVCFNIDAFAGI